MGKATRRVFGTIGMLLLAILACGPGPAPSSAVPTRVVSIEEALTITVQTLTGQASTVSLPTPVDIVQTMPATFTLEANDLSSVPPTDTSAPSPRVPLASVSVATNCRTGPGQVYDRVAVVDVSMLVQVIGKFTPDNYWIVLMPDGSECWLWGKYATTAGDVNSLPEIVPPPTPTPAIGSVMGTITNSSDGRKLANVLVTAQISKRTATTDSYGSYRIDDLATGPEFITAEDGFHKSQFQSVTIHAGNIESADFALSFQYNGLFKYILEGTVLLNSMPASGANVSVWSRNATTITDSNGHYRLEFSTGALATPFLIVAELGNARGAAQVDPPPLQTTTVPDISLVQR